MLNLFKNTIYVRIKAERIAALHVESGIEVADEPTIAIKQENGKASIAAFGHEATMKAHLKGVTLANGFKHPRTLIADFTVAEQTLKQFIKKVSPSSLMGFGPAIVVHPQACLEGGLTQVEVRAFAELAIGAGARKAYVWVGPELTKEELHALNFSHAAGELLYP